MINLLHGDCLEQMKTLEDNSVDSIVSDPPYGISFMAKKWDYDVPSVEVWKEAMRVLKPGGHALIACGTRTQHRMVVNIEDAGFEIRDVVSWIYGSGFPKSLNISKAIDKAAGAEREVVGEKAPCGMFSPDIPHFGSASDVEATYQSSPITAPATDAAKQWDGWGTALKPSSEFFTLCRKPLSEKTIAANVLKWGTGGINIDACRVETDDKIVIGMSKAHLGNKYGSGTGGRGTSESRENTLGRFPANLIHDGSQEVLELFPETKPSPKATRTKNSSSPQTSNAYGQYSDEGRVINGHGDSGSAARFFKSIETKGNEITDSMRLEWLAHNADVCSLEPHSCLNEGSKDMREEVDKRIIGDESTSPRAFYCAKASKKDRNEGNNHPTVKPTALMSYLCRLITPTGGVVLDPYMGSGSTGKAAVREGFSFVGCELDKDYFDIATARVTNEES